VRREGGRREEVLAEASHNQFPRVERGVVACGSSLTPGRRRELRRREE